MEVPPKTIDNELELIDVSEGQSFLWEVFAELLEDPEKVKPVVFVHNPETGVKNRKCYFRNFEENG